MDMWPLESEAELAAPCFLTALFVWTTFHNYPDTLRKDVTKQRQTTSQAMITFSLTFLVVRSLALGGKDGFCFGWNISAYVYLSTGLLVSQLLSSVGVSCCLYIDDRHNGQLQSKTSDHAVSTLATPSDESRFAVSKAAVFLAAYTLASLGHKVGLKECVFTPQKRIVDLQDFMGHVG